MFYPPLCCRGAIYFFCNSEEQIVLQKASQHKRYTKYNQHTAVTTAGGGICERWLAVTFRFPLFPLQLSCADNANILLTSAVFELQYIYSWTIHKPQHETREVKLITLIISLQSNLMSQNNSSQTHRGLDTGPLGASCGCLAPGRCPQTFGL